MCTCVRARVRVCVCVCVCVVDFAARAGVAAKLPFKGILLNAGKGNENTLSCTFARIGAEWFVHC